jgi:hypothetical protein
MPDDNSPLKINLTPLKLPKLSFPNPGLVRDRNQRAQMFGQGRK